MKYVVLAFTALVCFTSALAQKKTITSPNVAAGASDSEIAAALSRSIHWRPIGPFRGGRSVAAAGVIQNNQVYYMGTTGGGVWKTEDAGLTWFNISDGYFKTGSVGAVEVAESDPNVVYVGMGEHAPRGVMTSYGDGVYKSTDAGKTWSHFGLELTRHISRITIHPQQPDVVLVGAQGALHGPSAERGVYKSTDGGKTWRKVLFIDENTGCSDLVMDMTNPRILYAAMWEHRRTPWQVISGGKGSGLFKSTDGGETWTKIQNGLPTALGKMGISICRSNPEKLYALIESDTEKETGGLFVSGNAGESWSRISKDHRLTQRAWYYVEVFADPQNENTVYVLNSPGLKSTDGGRTWTNIRGTHGDYHHLWINPHHSENMIVANDGGAAISFNGGKVWSTQSNQPTAQFYRVNADNQFPYNLYAGQQDNSTVKISSRSTTGYSIGDKDWTSSAGGESAFLAFDPNNPQYVVGGSYQGTIDVLDTKSGESTNIMIAPIQYQALQPKQMKYRFNWNAPIIWSKHEPQTFYHAGNHLFKTKDMGRSWEIVSPDLTRNDSTKQGVSGVPYTNEGAGGENYGTISYVIESPHEKGVIWTGSDDGMVHLTRDGGKQWINVTPAGLEECLINCIEISPHEKGTAYIATTRYKLIDFAPSLYVTKDYGATWK
ncbi:MAG: WD40/YVTN/BNR-like repeat-containing protein, partial [Chitinophagaceae bacterium]